MSRRAPIFALSSILDILHEKQQKLTIDEFFELLLPLLLSYKDKVKDILVYHLYTYFLYLKDFIAMIRSLDVAKYREILFKVAGFIKYEKWSDERVVMRYGEKGEKFYLILKGKVDILILKEKTYSLSKEEYYHYIAMLIGYREYEVLNRVINFNCELLPLNITDSIGYGKLVKGSNTISTINITLMNLFDMLSNEEKIKYKSGFEGNVDDDVKNRFQIDQDTPLGTKDYIGQFMQFLKYNKYSDPIKHDFKLLDYFCVTSLVTGQMFGGVALSDPSAKRTATIITSAESHFGVLNKESYNSSLKEAAEQIRKENMQFVLSTYIFKDISSTYLLKRYYNNFVISKHRRGESIIVQDEPNQEIMFLKTGEYEIITYISFRKLTSIINSLYDIIKKPTYDCTEKELKLNKEINEINKENQRISYRSADLETMRKFYTLKEEISISSMKSSDIVGFIDCVREDNQKAYFSIKLKSEQGECLKMNRQIFHQMCLQNPLLTTHESQIINAKVKKMLRRLIDLRAYKLQYYFLHHPDYIYFKEFSSQKKINLYRDILRLEISPKEKKLRTIFSASHLKTLKPSGSTNLFDCIDHEERMKAIEDYMMIPSIINSTKHNKEIKEIPQLKVDRLITKVHKPILTSHWKTRNKQCGLQGMSTMNNPTSPTSSINNNLNTFVKNSSSTNDYLSINKNTKGTTTRLLTKSNSDLKICFQTQLAYKPIDMLKNSLDETSIDTLQFKISKLKMNLFSIPSCRTGIGLVKTPIGGSNILNTLKFRKKNNYIKKSELKNIKHTRDYVVRYTSQFSRTISSPIDHSKKIY